MPRQAPLSQVSEAILAYLQQHPAAADTAQGIACWWLPASLGRNESLVEQALEALWAQGRLHRQVNTDRQVIYFALPLRDTG